MALSGTLDTFAIPDVLRLLASTAKTGRLRISGSSGSGSVWVDHGDVVATELAPAGPLPLRDTEVIFGLLRFETGSFTFEADAVALDAAPGASMEPILGAAEHMLAEWRSIEEVVPSLDVVVALRRELGGSDVMIDAERWRCIALVGAGVEVRVIAETLERNEVDTCRLVKELIELGLLEKVDVSAPAALPADHGPQRDGSGEVMIDPMGDPAADLESSPFADRRPVDDDPAPVSSVPTDVSDSLGGQSRGPEWVSVDNPREMVGPFGAVGDSELVESEADQTASDDLSPAEMARHLANLSPRAAKAVAAAARATTEAERDAALAAVEAEDDSVNRSLLLQFLGSVDS